MHVGEHVTSWRSVSDGDEEDEEGKAESMSVKLVMGRFHKHDTFFSVFAALAVNQTGVTLTLCEGAEQECHPFTSQRLYSC